MKIKATVLLIVFSSCLPLISYADGWGARFAKAKEVLSDPEVRMRASEAVSSGLDLLKRKPHLTPKKATSEDSRYLVGSGRISYVYDGDTYLVETAHDSLSQLVEREFVTQKYVKSDTDFVIRLANINTEESVHFDASKNTKFGKKTSEFVKSYLSGREVSYECYERGYYGRAICSISTSDGDLGQYLIKGGYSDYVTKYGNHPTKHKEYMTISENF